MMRTLASAVILSLAIATGAAFAETAQPGAPGAAPTDKQAISKACSAQADAQKLHGKDRKKFRRECRRRGGKSAT
jgi:hypothetical protein